MTEMDAGLIVMLVCLGVFLILAIIGLVVLGRRMMALYGAATALQKKVDTELTLLTEKQQLIMQRVELIQASTQVIQERSAALSANIDRLSFLIKEFSAARDRLRNLFPLQP